MLKVPKCTLNQHKPLLNAKITTVFIFVVSLGFLLKKKINN